MADNQRKLQDLSNKYQQLQDGLQTSVTARQKLEAQQEENRAVQREFTTLTSDSTVYKLIGPVLLKQDSEDAKRTVDGRLEYIGKEIKRVEAAIGELQGNSDRVRVELADLQQKIRSEGQGGAGDGS